MSKRHDPQPQHQRAFTLTELLVVIAIIAVLTGILIPTINTVKKLANRTQATNAMRNLGLAVHSYTLDWEGFLPGPMSGGLKVTYKKNTSNCEIGLLLWSYLECPAPSSSVTNTLTPLVDKYRELSGYPTFFLRNNHYFPSGVKTGSRFDPTGYPGSSWPHLLSEISRQSTTIFFQDADQVGYGVNTTLPVTAFYGKYLTLYYDNHVEAINLPLNQVLY